jgi:hypothetical protein
MLDDADLARFNPTPDATGYARRTLRKKPTLHEPARTATSAARSDLRPEN